MLKAFHRTSLAALFLSAAILSGCNTTSGSTRLDETGRDIASANGYEPAVADPQNAAYYIQALKGGLMGRIAGVRVSSSDRTRGLEAEYKALESAPTGQKVVWTGSAGLAGEVVAATPYQVGSQNCRQYTHSISISGAAPQMARGAACRNANGSWTPLI